MSTKLITMYGIDTQVIDCDYCGARSIAAEDGSDCEGWEQLSYNEHLCPDCQDLPEWQSSKGNPQ